MSHPLRLLVAAFVLIANLAPVQPAGAAAANADSSLPPPPATRQVNINGRFVTVRLSIRTVIPGAPLEGGNLPITTATASISIQDGASLPRTLRVASVVFERFYGTDRVFNTPLAFSFSPTNPEQFELDTRQYTGDIRRGQLRGAYRLQAVVRLAMNGRFIRVPMGTLPVVTEALP